MSEETKQSKTENNSKWTKKSTVKAIVTIVIIALLITFSVIFVKKNDANAQLNQFTSSIENNNPERLATILSTNEREMTKAEAEHLITYFKQRDNAERLNKTINNVKANIKSDESSPELGTLRDKNNQPILDFSKNGKKMFFLGKLSIDPHYRAVYIKEADNTATYNLGEGHQVAVDKNKLNKLGSFVVGNYNIDAKKEFKDGAVKGEVDGTIHIDTDNIDESNRVIGKQSFNQSKIKIELHNADKLDDKSLKLMINGETTELNTNKTYGYFPNSDSFTVQAEGKKEEHIFKTNEVNVLQGTTNNSIQTINLEFNDKEIEKTLEKEEEEKSKMSSFIKDYMESLNKAYKHTDYDEIKKYIKEGSKADEFMEPKFEKKADIKYKNTKVKSVEKTNDVYEIVISKQYKDNTITTEYKVKDNKIIEIQDVQ